MKQAEGVDYVLLKREINNTLKAPAYLRVLRIVKLRAMVWLYSRGVTRRDVRGN